MNNNRRRTAVLSVGVLVLSVSLATASQLAAGDFDSLWGEDRAPLRVFHGDFGDGEQWASTVRFPNVESADYIQTSTLAMIYTVPVLGQMHKLQACLDGDVETGVGDHFLSPADQPDVDGEYACKKESFPALRNVGWVWSGAGAGREELWRCLVAGDRVTQLGVCGSSEPENLLLGYVEPLLEVATGFDPGLETQCVNTSGDPASENYYEDNTECSGSPPPTVSDRWRVNVFTGDPCPDAGAPGQHWEFNASDSPVSIKWSGNNPKVELKTAFTEGGIEHCNAQAHTIVQFSDKASVNGSLPHPSDITLSIEANYNYLITEPGATGRATLTWRGAWDGRDRVVAIDIHNTDGLGDNYPFQPDVRTYRNEAFPNDRETVRLDGEPWGIYLPIKFDWKVLRVDWYLIIDDLIERGFLGAPEDPATVRTREVRVSHEVYTEGLFGVTSAFRVRDLTIQEVLP